MTTIKDLVRDLFAPRDRQADPPGVNGPRTAIPEMSLPGRPTSPNDDPQRPLDPEDAVGVLPVAQGQELLGPCRDCGGWWTREITRGQKPRSCDVCKREGPPDS